MRSRDGLLLILILLSSCSFTEQKSREYESLEFFEAKGVLKDQCASCHRFTTYTPSEYVEKGLVVPGYPKQSLLYRKLQGAGAGGEENMPPGAPLPPEQVRTIASWISTMPHDEPGDGVDPIYFKRVQAVLVTKCNACHDYGSLSQQEFLDNGLIVAGQPAESKVFQRLKGSGVGMNQDMPRDADISAEEVEFFRAWIATIVNTGPNAATRFKNAREVMGKHCASCHGTTQPGSAGTVPAFSNFSDEMKFVESELIYAEAPLNSWLYRSLRGTPGDIATMPLGWTLKDEEIKAIELWIRKYGTP